MSNKNSFSELNRFKNNEVPKVQTASIKGGQSTQNAASQAQSTAGHIGTEDVIDG
ncbi:MAG: hypothetical protein AAF990_16935 [Bacteroidota bacterium]